MWKAILPILILHCSLFSVKAQTISIEHLRELMKLGKYTQVIEEAGLELTQNKADANLYNIVGCATIYQSYINDEKNNKEAILFFTKAIQLDSSVANFYVNRGWAYQSLDNYVASYKDYKKALSLDSNRVELHGHVLRTMWLRKKYKEAYAFSTSIIEKFPTDGYAYHVRGNLKRDYLHKYPEGNLDIKESNRLGWRAGFYLEY